LQFRLNGEDENLDVGQDVPAVTAAGAGNGSGGGAGERLGWRVLAKGPLPCCACQPASPW
ncbi:MAG TPA: hypothetical protein VHH34_15950, partial [Pseudonocardiaceae bacterium]|nr:hypothetical protein [Pseudonocardiaceae bacterium]